MTSVAAGAAPALPLLVGEPERRGALLRPEVTLAGVLAVWVLVPSLVVPTKVAWSLLLLTLGWVLGALVSHRREMRWSTSALLLLVPGLCAALGTPRHGALLDLLQEVVTSVLVVGCALLAAGCDGPQRSRLVRLVLSLALLELAVAGAESFLGLPAVWGTVGIHPGVNELLPWLGRRATGTLAHPIPFGALMAVGSVLALFALRAPRSVRLALSAACAGGVLLSGSRSALIVLVLAVVLGMLWPGATRLGTPARLAAGLVLGVVLLQGHVTQLLAVRSLSGTGSLTHRLAAIDAVGRLLGRAPAEMLLGSGAGSLPSLFAAGLLQTDGFQAVDDQLVTTFALGGLVGVAALVGAVVIGLLRGDRSTRPAALVVVLMFGSFDVLEWTAPAVLLGLVLALGSVPRAGSKQAGEGAGPPLDAPRSGPRTEPLVRR